MLDDVDSMIHQMRVVSSKSTMQWQGDSTAAAELASSCRRKVTLENVDRNDDDPGGS
jgi:hypothetical protein